MPDQAKRCQSANGAEYESQGQATKERRPWFGQKRPRALKGRNKQLGSLDSVPPLQGSSIHYVSNPGAALLRRLPLAVIFSAFGA
ncbi:MAG: hypothetical protein ACR2G5_13025, partial [Pyrinomonadaceae bacterium]